MVRHDILFISQRCPVIFIQHVCVSFFGLVFIIVIHQLKWEALQDLKDNRTFSAQSRATTRCNAATADSSNKVRTISHDIIRGTLRCLQLLEPLSAHSHVVVHAENCKFPSSIAAPKTTCSSFPQIGFYNVCNFVLFLDPILHLHIAFMWKG